MQFIFNERRENVTTVEFKNTLPINNILKLNFFMEENITGVFQAKEFKYSFDNVIWWPWNTLTQDNLKSINFTGNPYFYLHVRYTRARVVDGNIKGFYLYYDGVNTSTPHTPDGSINADFFQGQLPEYYLNQANHFGPYTGITIENVDADFGMYHSRIDSLLGTTFYFKNLVQGDGIHVSESNGRIRLDVSLNLYVSDASLGTQFVWDASGFLVVKSNIQNILPDTSSIKGLYHSNIDNISYFKNIKAGYGLEFMDDGSAISIAIDGSFNKAYVTTFDPTGITSFSIPAGTHKLGRDFTVYVYEGQEPIYPHIVVDSNANLTISWIANSLSQECKAILLDSNLYFFNAALDAASFVYVDGSLASRDSSINWLYGNTQPLGFYVKEASLGLKFFWAGGMLDVSAGSGDVTKAYVDGSLAALNASVGLMKAAIDISMYDTVDMSTYFYDKNYIDASFNIFLSKANFNSSINVYATNSSVGIMKVQIDASFNALPLNDYIDISTLFYDKNQIDASFAIYATNASVGLMKAQIDSSILPLSFTDASTLQFITPRYNQTFDGSIKLDRLLTHYSTYTVSTSTNVSLSLTTTKVIGSSAEVRFIANGGTMTFDGSVLTQSPNCMSYDTCIGKINWISFYYNGVESLYSNSVLN